MRFTCFTIHGSKVEMNSLSSFYMDISHRVVDNRTGTVLKEEDSADTNFRYRYGFTLGELGDALIAAANGGRSSTG